MVHPLFDKLRNPATKLPDSRHHSRPIKDSPTLYDFPRHSMPKIPLRHVSKAVRPLAVASPPLEGTHCQGGPYLLSVRSGPQGAVQAWANTVPETNPPVSLTLTSQPTGGPPVYSAHEGFSVKPAKKASNIYREHSLDVVDNSKEKIKTNMTSKNLVRAKGVLDRTTCVRGCSAHLGKGRTRYPACIDSPQAKASPKPDCPVNRG